MDFRLCAIIPSYNHSNAVAGIVQALRGLEIPVYIIDDGNGEPVRSVLARLNDHSAVRVHRLQENEGKGAAVMYGFRLAAAAGFTHALQIDADGQHDIAAVPALVALAKSQPSALVTGVPVYDSSAPLGRVIGRYITHFWVWIETLSFRISDSMCGFRIYPLASTCRLLDEVAIGARMEFDTQIMVRLFWRGVPVLEHPVQVTYPKGNVSNFHVWRENWRITCMHTKLVCIMLLTLPKILLNRPPETRPSAKKSTHWASLDERGARWGLAISAQAYRWFGRRGCLALMAPVILYFYLSGREQRRASQEYLRRVFAMRNEQRIPGFLDGYRHFMSFAGRVVDSFAAWIGGIPAERVVATRKDEFEAFMASPSGALLIVSHMGNADLARALMDPASRSRLLVLVHTKHAENFNRLMRDERPETAINTWQVTELGPEVAIELKARVEQGAWIVIAGDRVPIGNPGRVGWLPFLGRPAPFSHGPYVLGSLLECPVYTLFCMEEAVGYSLSIVKLTDRILLPRGSRDAALQEYAKVYAERLAEKALRYPWQWYNFFDFWNAAQRKPAE